MLQCVSIKFQRLQTPRYPLWNYNRQNNIEIDRTLGDGAGEFQKWKSRSVTSVLD